MASPVKRRVNTNRYGVRGAVAGGKKKTPARKKKKVKVRKPDATNNPFVPGNDPLAQGPNSKPTAGVGGTLAPVQIGQLWCQNGGRKNVDVVATAIGVAMAESGGDTQAKNTSGNSPASTDRGLFQINDYWHKEVSDACAFNAECNTKSAVRISGNGRSWSQWATFEPGIGDKYKEEARRAIAQADNAVFSPKTEGGDGGGLGINFPDIPVGSAIGDIVKFIARLFEPEFWLRVGKALLGFIFLLFGVQVLMKVLVGAELPKPPVAKLAGKLKG